MATATLEINAPTTITNVPKITNTVTINSGTAKSKKVKRTSRKMAAKVDIAELHEDHNMNFNPYEDVLCKSAGYTALDKFRDIRLGLKHKGMVDTEKTEKISDDLQRNFESLEKNLKQKKHNTQTKKGLSARAEDEVRAVIGARKPLKEKEFNNLVEVALQYFQTKTNGYKFAHTAYDAIIAPIEVDFSNKKSIRAHIKNITLIEIKSTERVNLGEDFNNYYTSYTDNSIGLSTFLSEMFVFVLYKSSEKKFSVDNTREFINKIKNVNGNNSISRKGLVPIS